MNTKRTKHRGPARKLDLEQARAGMELLRQGLVMCNAAEKLGIDRRTLWAHLVKAFGERAVRKVVAQQKTGRGFDQVAAEIARVTTARRAADRHEGAVERAEPADVKARAAERLKAFLKGLEAA